MSDELDAVADKCESRDDAAAVLSQYLKMHEGKLGAHWLYAVIGSICAGAPEEQAMANFGWVRVV